MWFTDDIWSTLERCWKPRPGDRPSVKDVLRCLENVSRSWIPPSPHTVAGLPSPAQGSEDESTDEVEVQSQQSQQLPPEGDTNKNNVYPPAHEFSGLPYGVLDYQDLGTSGINPKVWESVESTGLVDRVSWADVLDHFRY